jgi:hypothetical protein
MLVLIGKQSFLEIISISHQLKRRCLIEYGIIFNLGI